MTDLTILTKMSVKTMKANAARAKAENKKVHLARIFGIAQGLKSVVDNRGEPITALTGQFRGTNVETGENFSAGVLNLPGGIHEMVENAVDTGTVDAKDRPIYTPGEFAFDISSAPATNRIGYSYEAESLVKAKESDPLEELIGKISEAKALPAPAPAETDKKGK